MDESLTGSIILGQSGPGSNGNEEEIPHFPQLQNRSLTTGCNLLLYIRYYCVHLLTSYDNVCLSFLLFFLFFKMKFTN